MSKVINLSPIERLGFPAAYADPAFQQCLLISKKSLVIVIGFEREHGVRIIHEKDGAYEVQLDEAQQRMFDEYIHETLYQKIDDRAIRACRERDATRTEGPNG